MKAASRRPPSVVVDFDGTVTSFDVGDRIALEFGLASRREILLSYNEGASVSAWMKRVFGREGAPSPSAIAAFVRRKALPRRGFLELARHCSRNKIPLEIASGGLDVYIKPLLASWGLSRSVRLSCGKAAYRSGRYSVRYPFPAKASLDSHKRGRVLALRRRGFDVIFCGDGTSDLSAAAAADRVFARYKLYHYCRKHSIPASSLRSFDPVLRLLAGER